MYGLHYRKIYGNKPVKVLKVKREGEKMCYLGTESCQFFFLEMKSAKG